jgi:hypothetical protein
MDSKRGFRFEGETLLDYEARGINQWCNVTFLPTAVLERPTNIYLHTARDKNGKTFESGKTYALTVPEDVPVKGFWSLTLYDRETWVFIYTDEKRYGLSSREVPNMKKNGDGSVTIYFGPEAPKGYENNWIPTEGKIPFVMFRLYGGVEEEFFMLNDVELVK